MYSGFFATFQFTSVLVIEHLRILVEHKSGQLFPVWIMLHRQKSFKARLVRNRSTGPEQIWPNITVGMIVVFQEILVLTRVRHKLNSKRVIVHTKM